MAWTSFLLLSSTSFMLALGSNAGDLCRTQGTYTCSSLNSSEILICGPTHSTPPLLSWHVDTDCNIGQVCSMLDTRPFCLHSPESLPSTLQLESHPRTPRDDKNGFVGESCASYGKYNCHEEGIYICNYHFSGTTLEWQLSNICSPGNRCTMVDEFVPYCLVPPIGTEISVLPTSVPSTSPTLSSLVTNTPTAVPPQPHSNSNPNSNPNQSTKPRKVVYIDASAHGVPTGSDFSVPGYANNEYNVIILCFWLTSAVYDIAFSWMQLPVQTQRGYLEAYHAAGKVVLVSAFGSTEFPTTGGVDATRSANAIADFVVKNGLDGVDVDYEDNTAMDAGTGEEWVITYTRVLRERLPRPYIISHAPQAPYFIKDERYYRGGGYLRVNREVGDLIDFYNVQFYNQGNTRYDTCETLFYASGNVFPGTSVFEITANGVELGKIVVGKPITRAGVVNSGFMEASDMARCFADARGKGWNAGVMGWQYTLDPSFQWISALSSVL